MLKCIERTCTHSDNNISKETIAYCSKNQVYSLKIHIRNLRNFFFNEMDQLSFGCWCSVCFVLMCARTVNKTAYSIQYLPPVHWHILMFIHSCLFIYSLFWRWWWWIRTFEMTSHNINLNKCAAHTFSMENLSLLIHRRPYIVQWRAAAISNFSLAA